MKARQPLLPLPISHDGLDAMVSKQNMQAMVKPLGMSKSFQRYAARHELEAGLTRLLANAFQSRGEVQLTGISSIAFYEQNRCTLDSLQCLYTEHWSHLGTALAAGQPCMG